MLLVHCRALSKLSKRIARKDLEKLWAQRQETSKSLRRSAVLIRRTCHSYGHCKRGFALLLRGCRRKAPRPSASVVYSCTLILPEESIKAMLSESPLRSIEERDPLSEKKSKVGRCDTCHGRR